MQVSLHKSNIKFYTALLLFFVYIDELRGHDWSTRYKVIKGICDGLHYLHVEKNIYQLLDCGGEVYPDEYFHAKSLVSGEYHITDNTYAIHHHTLLWVPFKTRLIRFLRLYLLVPVLGKKRYIKLVNKIKRR